MSYDKAMRRVRFGVNAGSGSQEGEWVTTGLTQLPRVRKPLGASGETEGPESGLPQSSVRAGPPTGDVRAQESSPHGPQDLAGRAPLAPNTKADLGKPKQSSQKLEFPILHLSKRASGNLGSVSGERPPGNSLCWVRFLPRASISYSLKWE